MTMIEIIARALVEKAHTGSVAENTLTGRGVSPKEQFERYARVAIEAMLEPTERMKLECLPPRERSPLDSYKAMVAVALDESKPPPTQTMG